eukprot:819915-Prymnesium_polylepis.1
MSPTPSASTALLSPPATPREDLYSHIVRMTDEMCVRGECVRQTDVLPSPGRVMVDVPPAFELPEAAPAPAPVADADVTPAFRLPDAMPAPAAHAKRGSIEALRVSQPNLTRAESEPLDVALPTP